jgi:hypothetical protein
MQHSGQIQSSIDSHAVIGGVSTLNPDLFTDKILNFCRTSIAGSFITSSSPADFDDMDFDSQIEERTAVQICGRILSYTSDFARAAKTD